VERDDGSVFHKDPSEAAARALDEFCWNGDAQYLVGEDAFEGAEEKERRTLAPETLPDGLARGAGAPAEARYFLGDAPRVRHLVSNGEDHRTEKVSGEHLARGPLEESNGAGYFS